MARLRLLQSDVRDGATCWLARLWCRPAFGGPEYCPAPPRDVEIDRERGVVTFRSATVRVDEKNRAITFEAWNFPTGSTPFQCVTPEQVKAELDIRHKHFGERLAGIVWSDRIYQPLARIPTGPVPVHPDDYELARRVFEE